MMLVALRKCYSCVGMTAAVFPPSFIDTLMMEAVGTSETSVYFKETTRRYIPEGCLLLIHRCENLISHRELYGFAKSNVSTLTASLSEIYV
jgi:hypothetical protein